MKPRAAHYFTVGTMFEDSCFPKGNEKRNIWYLTISTGVLVGDRDIWTRHDTTRHDTSYDTTRHVDDAYVTGMTSQRMNVFDYSGLALWDFNFSS